MTNKRDFIGAGWAFPPRPDGRGGIATASDDEKIKQAIWIILGTPIGQRVMRPTFGSRLHELVFAPLNAETMGMAEMFVIDALKFWEPRIEVTDVVARTDRRKPAMLLIDVQYSIKATHDQRSLVYPFYRIPGE
ncbi:MAG: GPW/gp25 family protein [Chloroflexi bacterium]|nr:GPW/gp25 family protein [Chloroflexota bacterium]